MIIVCPSCQARYKFDESKLGNRPRARTKCAKCGGSIDIENPLLAAMTLPPGAMAPPAPVPKPATAPGTAPSHAPAEVEAPTRRNPSAPEPAKKDVGGGTITGRDLHKMGLMELPKDKRYSLAVIQGAATGNIFPITKTRTTIGRAGNDINLDDAEASRQHAVVEIYGERAVLRDLGSTNGTFIEIERVEHSELGNQQEFRIGSHVLMLIITEVE
jgi:predicted Zn finger-like uncharacterized protein